MPVAQPDQPPKSKNPLPDIASGALQVAANYLLKQRQKPLENHLKFVGSATCHFQSEPILSNGSDPVSDWELELKKNIEGKPSKIAAGQRPAQFPRLLEKRDLYLARSAYLGENMFRISFDFARLCPRQEEFNTPLMSRYVRMLARMRAFLLEPMVTLHHWPMPKSLLRLDGAGATIVAGGWEHPDVLKHFRFYVDSVLAYLNDRDRIRSDLEIEGCGKQAQEEILSGHLVNYFLTINEPSVILLNGYLFGAFPPYKKYDFAKIRCVAERLAHAHDYAFDAIKAGRSSGSMEQKVGVANNWTYFDGLFGGVLHKLIDEKITRLFERNGERTDFIGLQYYFRATVPSLYPPIGNLRSNARTYGDHPSFGDVYPRGLFEVLRQMHALYPGKQIFVTEFGFSDRSGMRQPFWILETVRYVIEAIVAGVPVMGILLWTLVNNFEWEHGMNQKFGLFDETELSEKPTGSGGSEIRSWEVWRTITSAIRSPSLASISELQQAYERAREQFAGISIAD